MQRIPLAVVILAAGKGKRMNSALPKVVHPLGSKPLMSYILDAVFSLNPDRVIAVVGYGASSVSETFPNPKLEFVQQKKLLGTGHAVLQTRNALNDFSGNVLVVCGDMPFIRAETLNLLIQIRIEFELACSLLTLKTSEKRDFGRIVRDSNDDVEKIVENRDATPAQKTIDEYNAGVYCFEKEWLFKAIERLDNNNAQSEYYLTDAIQFYYNRRAPVRAVQTDDAKELFGVNSQEDLKQAERFLNS
jgi:bifunctional UDP-N-acetylglucosamine pyrophosphorylase / glucosamine-1-phosphate N-acetyltransferase